MGLQPMLYAAPMIEPPETVERILGLIPAASSAHRTPACVNAARYPPPDNVTATAGAAEGIVFASTGRPKFAHHIIVKAEDAAHAHTSTQKQPLTAKYARLKLL